MNKVRIIAFYLPQYYPIPENDLWWGKGFTEWTNVGKAKPLFHGHYQPRVPADLGYYDLRLPEIRCAQAEMAKKYGIEGFCYWHYWFGNGKRLLERPFNEVLKSGEPDFPFCLAWANQTWKGFPFGLKDRNVLIEQKYPGKDDIVQHFNLILPALLDDRYIRVENKPLFQIYQPLDLPNAREFIDLWQNLAIKNGLDGIFFVGNTGNVSEIPLVMDSKFDAVCNHRLFAFTDSKMNIIHKTINKFNRSFLNRPNIVQYKDAMKYFVGVQDKEEYVFPCIYPNWDHTPRSGRDGLVFHNSTPKLFKIHVKQVIDQILNKPDERKIVFLKSWNEWAEGNYVEPDLKYGHGFLESIAEVINDKFENY